MTESQPPIIDNPYVGPRTFGRAERQLFFGREQEARDLLSRVMSERLLLFYAQSGAGKSSLINTRLIPALQAEGFAVLPVGRVSGELPAGVGGVVNIYLFNLMLSLDQGKGGPATLAGLSLSDFLAGLVSEDGEHWAFDPQAGSSAVPANTGGASAQPFVLVIDQFEEIITGHPDRWQEREEFFRQLNRALVEDPNLWVLLTLREDYVAALDPYAPLLFNRLRPRFYMERMGVAGALEAVRRPAALDALGDRRRPFAAGVAEKLVEDLRQVRVPGQEATIPGQYVEPVQLQVVCYQLWENLNPHRDPPPTRGRERDITFDDLARAGDVDQALVQFYEETLAVALADPAAQGIGERQLRAWFDNQLITEAGTRGLVHQGKETTGGLPNAVVGKLQARFLVRSEMRSGGTWLELVHDRFVEPIRESNAAWFEEHLSVLQRQAMLWEREGRPEGLLLRADALEEAEGWARSHEGSLRPHEEAFLAACRRAAQELLSREQRTIRTIRILAAVASVVAILALIGFAVAAGQRSQAQANAAAAAKAAMSAETEAAAANTAQVAAVFAAEEALSQKATAEAYSTIAADALAQSEANLRALMTAQAPTATPTETMVAEIAQSTPTAVGPRPPVTASNPPPPLNPGEISSPTSAGTPTSNPTVILQATQLAEVIAKQTALAVEQVPTATPTAIPLSPPRGNIVFTSDRNLPAGEGNLYRVDNRGQNLQQLTFLRGTEPNYSRARDAIAFSVKSGPPAPLISLFAIGPKGGEPVPLDEPNPDKWDNWEPSWSPDGQHVAYVSSNDNRDWEIWTIQIGNPKPVPLTNQQDVLSWAPAWSPDGRYIAFVSGSRDSGSLDIWRMNADGSNPVRLTRGNYVGPFYPEWTLSWSPDGKQIAFPGNRDGNLDIYVMNVDGSNQRNVTRSPENERDPAWSPDGNWLAFTRFVGDNGEIFIATLDGRNLTRITTDPAYDRDPIWIP